MHAQREAEWHVPDQMGTRAEPRTDLEFSALHLEVSLQWSWFQQLVLTWSLSSASKNPEAPPPNPWTLSQSKAVLVAVASSKDPGAFQERMLFSAHGVLFFFFF